MEFRIATIEDIPQMQVVRNQVQENKLSDPSVVKDEDYVPFIEEKGRGWVCVDQHTIVGFAFVDVDNHNIWALFVNPDCENKGIGKKLHDDMLDWYFSNHEHPLWLSTAPGTRAEKFYELKGWTRAGSHGKEVKFEMSSHKWLKKSFDQ